VRAHRCLFPVVLQSAIRRSQVSTAMASLRSVAVSCAAHQCQRHNVALAAAQPLTSSNSTPVLIGQVDVAPTADTFSQGRVANVVRRLKDQSSRDGNQHVVVEKLLIDPNDAILKSLASPPNTDASVGGGSGDVTPPVAVHLWRCTTQYSMYVPSRPLAKNAGGSGGSTDDVVAPYVLLEFTAVGLSREERLATLAAAMHAERLLDYSGVHMFALPRMQENHAKAARAQKRWAPVHTEGRDDMPPSTKYPLPVLIPGAIPAASPTNLGGVAGKPKRLNPFSTNGRMSSSGVVGHNAATSSAAIDIAYRKQRAQQYDETWRTSPLLPFRTMSDIGKTQSFSVGDATVDDRVSSCTVFRNTDDYKKDDDDDATPRRHQQQQQHRGANHVSSAPPDASSPMPSAGSTPSELFDAFHLVAETIDPDDVVIVDVCDATTPKPTRANGPPPPATPVVPPTAKHRMMSASAFVVPHNAPITTDAANLNNSAASPAAALSSFELVEDDDRFELENLPNLICLRDQHAAGRLSDACSATYSVIMMLAQQCPSDDDAASTTQIPAQCADVRSAMRSEVGVPGDACNSTGGVDEQVLEYAVPTMLLLMGAAILQSTKIRGVWSRMSAELRHRCVERWISPSSPLLSARGVAVTRDTAEDLCAMHAERLLEQLGVNLFEGCGDVKRDAAIHDACLRYGRRRSPTLLSKYELEVTLPNVLDSPNSHNSEGAVADADAMLRVATEVEQLVRTRIERLGRSLQKPLKSHPRKNDIAAHSFQSKMARKKEALSMHGMLLQLNRAIINSQRIHVLEVDFDNHPDWLIEAEEDLRNYFIEQNSARLKRRSSAALNGMLLLEAELCMVNFVYTPGAQYRCSVFLPVPKEFGIRGGYAVGVTATTAKRLCAFHALDVLCAIGVPVYRDPSRQAAFLAKRAARGLIQPASAPLHDVRSPPGYREIPGHATTVIPPASTVWRVMMTDVAEFDVLRSVEHFYTTSSTQPQLHRQVNAAQKPISPYGKSDEVSVLRELAFRTLERLGVTPKRRLVSTSVLASDQHLGRRRRLPANNMWLVLSTKELVQASQQLRHQAAKATTATGLTDSEATQKPFPPEIVAWGRCIHRKGSERAMIIHLLRLLLALNIDVAASVSNGQALLKAFLEVHGRPEDKRGAHLPSPTNRMSAVGAAGAEFAPLPCPVMSSELASRTFV
jgi:hypothetical protein